jgi:3-hydroxybutyryl-CoA dehydrogenase
LSDITRVGVKEPLSAAPLLLLRMTAAGLLGRKAGRGFYDYSGSSASGAR